MEDFKIISWEELIAVKECLFPQGTSVTIGGFDGPHKGHKELFKYVLNYSEKNGIPSGIITFFRPPVSVKNGSYSGDVSTLRLRLKKFRELGFRFVVLIDFSSEFAKIEGKEFFDILIKTIRIKYLAVGEDFSCGYRRGFGAVEIKELASQIGFCFDSIKSVNLNGNLRISSTAIRNAVAAGDFTLAKNLLGYPFLFDIVGPAWLITENNSLSALRSYITQILPNYGKYKVLIKTIDGAVKKAVFFVKESEVGLCLEKDSTGQFGLENLNNFDAIEFICKE
ncbi:FAD synthetase family protein [Treponema pedis]|uniref:FAD synthase n=1 Tax=Treponema pedis TaxID=409322 RepID=A0A7S6WPL0_9SPIR|nr:FAD synthetase family protein [Treponema pedis]QOW60993.1 FAD synthetase family protein [Treponema pedis]QSI04266.1 riboflavin biosynthesis protein [Treponema pedis]